MTGRLRSVRARMAAFFLISWVMATSAGAEVRGLIIREPSEPRQQPDQRVALVIGNAAYDSAPLRNPANDARSMAQALRGLGFDVLEKENLAQKEMKREIQLFGQKLQKGGIGLFYYAGHGMQVGGRNYLIPVGAAIEHEKQVEYEAVDLGSVLSEMDYARNRMNIIILDACRDNPFARSFRSAAEGLAAVNAPSGTLIAYATSPGAVASDGPGEHGIYTGELIKTMSSPGVKIEDVFKQVRATVRQLTDGKQVPWESSSLEGDFYFKPIVAESSTIDTVPAERSLPGLTASRGGDSQVHQVKIWKEPVTGIEFVWIAGGCYQMGTPDTEADRDPDEGPLHQVCVDGFWIGKTEVTNGQFRKFQPDHDSRDYHGVSLNGDDQPAVFVSWDDAEGFVKWLRKQSGGQYEFRLPTEAEWEYACRASTDASHYWGNDSGKPCGFENVADQTAGRLWSWDNIHECDDGYAATAPVGSFQPNGFGLFDMLGNVKEWCRDTYKSDAYARHWLNNPLNTEGGTGPDAARVIRGGNWSAQPAGVRCGMRASGLSAGRNDDLGFRIVRKP